MVFRLDVTVFPLHIAHTSHQGGEYPCSALAFLPGGKEERLALTDTTEALKIEAPPLCHEGPLLHVHSVNL